MKRFSFASGIGKPLKDFPFQVDDEIVLKSQYRVGKEVIYIMRLYSYNQLNGKWTIARQDYENYDREFLTSEEVLKYYEGA
jgi:hypothetical protein